MERKELYKPFKSTAKNKKYSVWVKSSQTKSGKKLIHFGDTRYGHFKDRIGAHSKLDHGDKERRKSYLARHGNKTDKNTAGYWAQKVLW